MSDEPKPGTDDPCPECDALEREIAARLTRERDEARAEVERLRHTLARALTFTDINRILDLLREV